MNYKYKINKIYGVIIIYYKKIWLNKYIRIYLSVIYLY